MAPILFKRKDYQGFMKAQWLTKPAYHINKRLYSIKEAADYLGRSP